MARKYNDNSVVYCMIDGRQWIGMVVGYDSSSRRKHPYLVSLEGFKGGHNGTPHQTSSYKGEYHWVGSKSCLWFKESSLSEFSIDTPKSPTSSASTSLDPIQDPYLEVLAMLS